MLSKWQNLHFRWTVLLNRAPQSTGVEEKQQKHFSVWTDPAFRVQVHKFMCIPKHEITLDRLFTVNTYIWDDGLKMPCGLLWRWAYQAHHRNTQGVRVRTLQVSFPWEVMYDVSLLYSEKAVRGPCVKPAVFGSSFRPYINKKIPLYSICSNCVNFIISGAFIAF